MSYLINGKRIQKQRPKISTYHKKHGRKPKVHVLVYNTANSTYVRVCDGFFSPIGDNLPNDTEVTCQACHFYMENNVGNS